MSKYTILENLKKNIKVKHPMPDLDSFEGVQYDNLVEKFIEMSKAVGGNAVELKKGENINDLIKSIYPEAKTIASNLKDITIATISPDKVKTPHELNGTDLGIIEGQLGVAENGAVWVPQEVKEKVVYFISEYLVIILDKKTLVSNMHQAYSQIKFSDKGFGVFISGPSKTADIEQALVVGAHGARGLTVILR